MFIPLIFILLSSTLAAPLTKVDGADAVPGKYIVKLKGDVTSLAEDSLTASISTKPDFRYSIPGFRGFAGSISDEELTRLQASEHVRRTAGLRY